MEINSQFTIRKELGDSPSLITDVVPPVDNTSPTTTTTTTTTATTTPVDPPDNKGNNTTDNPIDLEKPTVVNNNASGEDMAITEEKPSPKNCKICKAYFIAHMSAYGALFIALLALAYNLTKGAKLPKK